MNAEKFGYTLGKKYKSLSSGAKVWTVIMLIVALGFAIPTTNIQSAPATKFTNLQKGKLCRHYIGKIMGRNPFIINHYKTVEGLVYVQYVRANDNTTWSYVCDVSSKSIVWAAFLNYEREWGRWRQEDRAALLFDKESNTVRMAIPERTPITVNL